MPQVSTPFHLFKNAGLMPAAFLAAIGIASAAAAQDGQPRDPLKKGVDGDKPKVAVSENMTVDIHVKGEPIGNVMELLSIQSQRNIILSRNVTGKVDADLYRVTFDEALEAILNVNGYVFEKRGNFIYVRTIEEQRELDKQKSRRVARIFRLAYLNANDAAEFVKPMLGTGGEIKTSAKVENFTIPENAPVGKMDYALGDTLAVFDQEENINQIEKILKEIDTRPAQVLVEATILETKLDEANAFGIDFSIIGDLKFSDFATIGGPRRVADSIIRGGTGASGGLSPANDRGTAVSSTAGNTQDGRSTFKLGVITDYGAVFARLLDDVSDTVVLSNPKLLALNRQPSRVLVGQRVGYLNTTASETSTTQTVEFLDTGTQLYFRPFVLKDGEIRMELKPQVSSATIRDAGNGQGGVVSIPDETTQQIVTNVIVKDGSTIVLGGLFVENTFAQRRQVPVLGDIPIIGAAFRGHDDTTSRRELIFLIRPSIVSDTKLAMAGADMEADIARIRAGQRQGLLPFSRDKMSATLNVEAEAAAKAGDTNKALYLVQKSLSLNPRQTDAIALRERITGERETWPTDMILEGITRGELNRRLNGVPTVPGSPYPRPWGSTEFPTEPAPAPANNAPTTGPGASAEPGHSYTEPNPGNPASSTAAADQEPNAQPEMNPENQPATETVEVDPEVSSVAPAQQPFVNTGVTQPVATQTTAVTAVPVNQGGFMAPVNITGNTAGGFDADNQFAGGNGTTVAAQNGEPLYSTNPALQDTLPVRTPWSLFRAWMSSRNSKFNPAAQPAFGNPSGTQTATVPTEQPASPDNK